MQNAQFQPKFWPKYTDHGYKNGYHKIHEYSDQN